MISQNSNKYKKLYIGILYLAVIFVFVAAALYTIMIARGYRFDFRNGLIKKTGMIVLVSRPSGADIYINDKKNYKKTGISILPTKISNIDPGDYKVLVKKENYRDWQKIIKVKEELVSWANYILLIPEKLTPKELVKNADISTFSLSPDKSKIAYVVKGNFREVYILDIEDEKSNLIKLPETQTTEIIKLDWNTDSTRILLTTKNIDRTESIIINTSNNKDFFLVPSDYYEITWNRSSSKELLALKNKSLYKIDVTKPTSTPVLLKENVISYTQNSNKIILAKLGEKQNFLISIDKNGANDKEITAIPYSKGYKISYSEKLDGVAFIAIDSKTLFYTYKFGSKTIMRELGKNIIDLSWSNEGQKLLYWGDDFAFVYDFEAENEKEYSLFSGQKIDHFRWYFDEYHLILGSDNKLKILEFDGANSADLTEIAGSKIEYLGDYKTFYFLRKNYSEQSGLFTLKLNLEEEKTAAKNNFLTRVISWFQF